MSLNNVSYTTCPVTDNGWLIRADQITLNLDKGEASAKKLGLKKLTAQVKIDRETPLKFEMDTGWINKGFIYKDNKPYAYKLEKIIAYEAVHEINSWDELRARLAPKDRRCFAFFTLQCKMNQ